MKEKYYANANEVVQKIAPILNHFYRLNEIAYHEMYYYKACGGNSRRIVDDYKRGSKAVRDYVENSDKPLDEITKEEMMNVFQNAMG